MMFYFFFIWTNFHYGFYFLYIYILNLFLRPNAMVSEKPLLLWFCEFVHSWRKGSLFNTVCVGNDHIFLRKGYESKTIHTSMGVCVCVCLCVHMWWCCLKKKLYLWSYLSFSCRMTAFFVVVPCSQDMKKPNLFRRELLSLSLSCACVDMEYLHFCRYLFYL